MKLLCYILTCKWVWVDEVGKVKCKRCGDEFEGNIDSLKALGVEI